MTEPDGRPAGVRLCSSGGGAGAGQMCRSRCSVCVATGTGGVCLTAAARSGKAGQQGSSAGICMGIDLACLLL
ncbi:MULTISPECIES: FBP domain-containing protein [Streptomyces]|uniref:Elongation factor G-binding protein C-terminal treble-clef zinc-finger domain-containing protein n=2 Tax=Streptomyces avermitilis TaxID=33903 RepID=Q82RR0_STRAW|nr:FBP domain-containing protein [Streptomyces avermitilis]BAC67792.1 hypothetical protein SAVERM_83 [Streptomyces avermitilis MA-4680 = NBRC 14893]BBJ47470.1 hypothetical protein SAVMC3_00990 [Streptomyces avermitilis]GDY69005.1 hypothetical protein SAV14893_083980 [Streptomyces avermitilis]GDY70613.1 hypothetical protein SAV31267_000980 [Streptomyces avermitilis]